MAVLSDPRLAARFDRADYELVRACLPWARNLALCDERTLSRVATNPSCYVVKHPLDTRGRGVLLGTEARSAQDWAATVGRGVRQNWLVQELVRPTTLPPGWSMSGQLGLKHDLAIVVANGLMVGALTRSSTANKLNVAGSGRFHPVLLG